MIKSARRRTAHPSSTAAIALLSSETLFRQGVVELLHDAGFQHVSAFSSIDRLREAAAARMPDIVVVDLDHERDDTRTVLRTLHRDLPGAHLISLGNALRQAATTTATHASVETPRAGREELASAAAGRTRRASLALLRELRRWQDVTHRQRDVLRWLAIGLDNEAIASKLRIGTRAVKMHITKLLDHFQLANRTELALLADHAGLQPPPVGVRAPVRTDHRRASGASRTSGGTNLHRTAT